MGTDIEYILKERGYESKQEYIESLAAEYGYDYNDVAAVADLLGDDELFDGLVSVLEDNWGLV